jgi:hypothetical protein
MRQFEIFDARFVGKMWCPKATLVFGKFGVSFLPPMLSSNLFILILTIIPEIIHDNQIKEKEWQTDWQANLDDFLQIAQIHSRFQ